MNEIIIQRAPRPSEYDIIALGETVGSISPNQTEGGYDINVAFGPNLPDCIDSDITVTIPTYITALRIAKALAVIGREPSFTKVTELAANACYRIDAATPGQNGHASIHTASEETTDFLTRTIGPLLQAASGPVAIATSPSRAQARESAA